MLVEYEVFADYYEELQELLNEVAAIQLKEQNEKEVDDDIT